MKQSTKLLCLVISLIMAFSCFSVIGSAALNKDSITYDNIDDAALTKEQVSNLALLLKYITFCLFKHSYTAIVYKAKIFTNYLQNLCENRLTNLLNGSILLTELALGC